MPNARTVTALRATAYVGAAAGAALLIVEAFGGLADTAPETSIPLILIVLAVGAWLAALLLRVEQQAARSDHPVIVPQCTAADRETAQFEFPRAVSQPVPVPPVAGPVARGRSVRGSVSVSRYRDGQLAVADAIEGAYIRALDEIAQEVLGDNDPPVPGGAETVQ